ncbi:MAG: NADP-dependent oxidoreductase [Steroidobacteraceae bacterium]|jgi:NADPH-dependent curcumin reductase CurA|nr:NADP-dependent oxidoreductase [Steroidobacteraceae bacterium]
MLDATNRQWVLAGRPSGPVRESDFRLVETPLAPLQPGQFRIRTLYLGVAAVMRGYMLNTEKFERPLQIGDVMHGRGVGRVVESRHPDYAVGEIVHGKLGWQDYAVADGSAYYLMYKVRQRVAPVSTALGVLGLTGFTSYLGLVDVGAVRPGDTVLVSGAAGGVGSNVGQIARNLGASAVGIAGSAAKCRLLTESLGYRAAIDYRNEDVGRRIGELCPEGIDVYFDNVGGQILDAGLAHLRRHARVVLCGAISQYVDGVERPYALQNAFAIFKRMARMEAFFIYEMAEHFPRAEQALASWIAAGRLHYQEDVLEGLGQMPRALIRLFEGRNVGKQLVKVAD